MENTSKLPAVSDRDIAYYNRRNQNRIFEALTSFFAEEAEQRDITKKDVADATRRDPASITRLLSHPSNITADTCSTFLLSLGAEMDYRIVRFSERVPANEMHPLIARGTAKASKADVQFKKAQPKARFEQPARIKSTNTHVLELNIQ